MIPNDPNILQAYWRDLLLHNHEHDVCNTLSLHIRAFAQSQDDNAAQNLIVFAQVCSILSNDHNFTNKLRDFYNNIEDDSTIGDIIRMSFTDFPPSRFGIPHTDATNAQSLISQPLGVQKMHARYHQRGTQEALLFSPWPPVIEILCQNPTIRERDILFMASRRPTQNELLLPILQSHWFLRPEIRFALSANPYLNISHALRIALSLPAAKLLLLSQAAELHSTIRLHAKNLLLLRQSP